MQRFEILLLAPAIILGTPAETGLNQKNSTSLTLGTQTAFDFLTPCYSWRLYPKMLNGAHKNLSNLLLNFVTYLRDTTLEVISKMQITFKDKRHTLINTIRCVIPPTRGRGPIRRRLKSYGGTGEKAESRLRRDEQYILRRSATP